MKDKWLDDLRESLSDFEMDAPEGLWESLGVEKPISGSVWNRRLMVAAAVISLLIVGSGIILWLTHTEPINVTDMTIAADIPASTKNTHNSNGNLNPTVILSSKYSPLTTKQVLSHNQNTENIQEPEHQKQPTESQEIPEDQCISPIDTTETVISQPDKTPYSRVYAYDGLSKKNKRDHNSERYSIGISSSGIGSYSSDIGNKFADLIQNSPNYSSNGTTDPGFATSSNTTTEIHHHQPVRFGLSLLYNISNRIGIETGLVYSGITSDITVRNDYHAAMGTRRLHYLGIPLNIKFSACSWKIIDLYLSAGVTGEKCISNRFETKFTGYGLSLDAFSHQKDKPLQWSVNAATGIQVRPIPNIGIFAEPGVSYYFNDGTPLATIYKDHPLKFNLNIGLRFTLNP